MIYKVYVLYSPGQNRLFTGITTSLTDQMKNLNSEYTDDESKEALGWTLVHMELFNNEDEAFLRETYLESANGQAYVREDILPLFNFN